MIPGLIDLLDNTPALRDFAEIGAETRTEPFRARVPTAAQAMVLAWWARRRGKTALVVTPTVAAARVLAESLRAYAPAGLPIHLLPEHDWLPADRLAADNAFARERVAVFARLADQPSLVIAPARALTSPVMSPEQLHSVSVSLRKGSRIRPIQLSEALARSGFQPAPLVEVPGQFSRRGGILDVFPGGLDEPVRVEFFGNEVESLRSFDPATQRSNREIPSLEILPASEVIPSPEGATDLRRIDATNLNEAAAERWMLDLNRIENGLAFEGIAHYAAYLGTAKVVDHLPVDALIVTIEPQQSQVSVDAFLQRADDQRMDLVRRSELPADFVMPADKWERAIQPSGSRLCLELSWMEDPGEGALDLTEVFSSPEPFGGRLHDALTFARSRADAGVAVVMVSQQSARLAEILADSGRPVATLPELDVQPEAGSINVVHGSMGEGLVARISPELLLLTDLELLGARKLARADRHRSVNRDRFLASISPGDFVVHVDHGVGVYRGLVRMPSDGGEREYLEVEYASADRLYVPVDQASRLANYVGPGDAEPNLTRLGTSDWQRARKRVKAAVQQMAKDLLELYAWRERAPGHAFGPDAPWQLEMEGAFQFVETDDQLTAINQIKMDMELPRPMDRLLCGDVGYGKTELALRAAFKAVLDGKQVAVLVPTTILAQQHFRTMSERFQPFPVKVEMLSRFRSDKEQDEVVRGLATGEVDICVGTHRLIQNDVQFKDLGLVIIDEEQRFGVNHKERLKRLRREVDVLTLSATPIPRTLHMALTGIRDMSVMETPPEDRLPIRTHVGPYDEELVRTAIRREMDRGGQTFFVHNRVQTIHAVAARLTDLVPEARIAVGHGQMHEDELERVMSEFQNGLHDVLVCSTIIESGLDMPNVNTIIVDRADRLGLAQLYQLRGRVGRGANRAFAYFLFPANRELTEVAEKRLKAIFEASELGAGFRIAMKDLEIRGAGNILGSEQHGNVASVGFHLYTQLLAEAVQELRGQPVPTTTTVSMDLPIPAHLPVDYIPDDRSRLALYQRLATARTGEEAGAIALELNDRFGTPPQPALNLLFVVQTKMLAEAAGLESVDNDAEWINLRLKSGSVFEAGILSSDLRKRVVIGRSLLRIPRKGAAGQWEETLRLVLEALASQRATQPAVASR